MRCTCEPRWTGEAPDVPAIDCPLHGYDAVERDTRLNFAAECGEELDYGGALGADGVVYSDADPGL